MSSQPPLGHQGEEEVKKTDKPTHERESRRRRRERLDAERKVAEEEAAAKEPEPRWKPAGDMGRPDKEPAIEAIIEVTEAVEPSEPAPETFEDLWKTHRLGFTEEPTEGSLASEIDKTLKAEEGFFKYLTKPFVLASEEQAKHASEFAMQGKTVEGTLSYLSSVMLGAIPVAFDTITTPIRPGLIAESVESIAEIALDWDPEVEKQAVELREKIEEQDIIFEEYKSDIIQLEHEYLKEQRKKDIIFSEKSKYEPESLKEFETAWAGYEADVLQSLSEAESGKMEYLEWKAEAESQLLELEGYSPREAVLEAIVSDPVRTLAYVGTGIAAGYATGKILGEVYARGKKAVFDWEMRKYTVEDWFPVETEMGMQYPYTEVKHPDWWRQKSEKIIVEDATKFDGMGIDDAVKWGDDLNPPWGSTEGGPTLMPKGTFRGRPWTPPELLRKYRRTGEGLMPVDYVDPRYAMEETIRRLVREPSPFSVPVITPGIKIPFDAPALQLSTRSGVAGGLLGGIKTIIDFDHQLKQIQTIDQKPIDLDQILTQKIKLDQIQIQDIEQTLIQDVDILQIQDIDQTPTQITEPKQVPITKPIQIQDIDQIQIPDVTQIQMPELTQVTGSIPPIMLTPPAPFYRLPPLFFDLGTGSSKREERGMGVGAEDWTWDIPDLDLGSLVNLSFDLDLDFGLFGSEPEKKKRKSRAKKRRKKGRKK